MGLRESKKAKTRQRISDLARDLFIEKGFAAVTVAEIAQKAEVAVATVFNYFPTKEAIIFDLEDEIDFEIVAAIQNRAKGVSPLRALRDYFAKSQLFNPPYKKTFTAFIKLLKSSPELNAYYRGIWDRYGKNLSRELQSEAGVSKVEAEALATLVLEGVRFASNSSSPKDALHLVFDVLEKGWAR